MVEPRLGVEARVGRRGVERRGGNALVGERRRGGDGSFSMSWRSPVGRHAARSAGRPAKPARFQTSSSPEPPGATQPFSHSAIQPLCVHHQETISPSDAGTGCKPPQNPASLFSLAALVKQTHPVPAFNGTVSHCFTALLPRLGGLQSAPNRRCKASMATSRQFARF